MLRIVILDTDRMVCHLLKEIIESTKCFQIVKAVNSIEALFEYQADLIIGEIHVGDGDLYDWILKQRMQGNPVDFIAITGNAEYKEYRRYAGVGAVDYILKPFNSTRVKQALLRYQKWKRNVLPDMELKQEQLDGFYYPGFVQDKQGISWDTYERIERYIQNSKKGWFTAQEAAMEMKISPVTMRRYLECMHQRGYLKIQSQYGNRGRPGYKYCIDKQEEE